MTAPTRVAVVGTGHLGRHHARLFAGLADAELVAVADIRLDRAQAVAADYGAEAVADHAALLDRVDAVSIAVPTEHHFAVARDFLDAGRPVLVEKPFTRTVEEADRLLALADRHGVPVHVGHVERFNPVWLAARPLLADPLYVDADRMGPFSFRSQDIGVVFDLMVHDIDLLLDVVKSPVADVEAVGAPVVSRLEDMASARIGFANGCIADLTVSRVASEAVRAARFVQRDGCIALDFAAQRATVTRRRASDIDPATIDPRTLDDVQGFVFDNLLSAEGLPIEPHNALEQELIAFLTAVRGGSPAAACTGLDARGTIALASRIVQAIRDHLEHYG
jgi:predicted dehydrogenase